MYIYLYAQHRSPFMPNHATYTEFRQSLAGYMDRVCDSHSPLTVTRQKGRSVVVLSEEAYEGLMETVHLVKSPVNA